MIVNLYFYNMDNQLSLFGFEEPKDSKLSEEVKEEKVVADASAGDEESLLHQDEELVVTDTSLDSDNTIAHEEIALSAFENETTKAESFLEDELNESIQPNKPLLNEQDVLFQNEVDLPIDRETGAFTEEKDLPPAIDETEEVSIPTIEPLLDEIIVPNKEVPTVDETLALDEMGEKVEDAIHTTLEESTTPIETENPEISENVILSELETDNLNEEKTFAPLGEKFGKKGRKSFKEIDAEIDLIQVPSDDILFSKQYYPISQVAKWFRVNNSLLRFWENEFDILKPRKNRKGDRLFRPEDIKNLQIIYYLLRQKKYTIAGAQKFIKNNRKTVDVNMKIVQTLNEFKRFLLELKVNAEG